MVLEFLMFSVFGWVFETVYGIMKTRMWEKRGFLYGPVCPIYGVGASAALLLARLLAHTTITYTWWQVFLVAFFGSAILEYATSWALEQLFHAYWWDYSNMPFNLNGRICLPASTLFGCAGVAIVYKLLPLMNNYEMRLPQLLYEFIAMVIVALFSVDATLTASALTNFANMVNTMEGAMNQRMEDVVESMNDATLQAIERVKGFRFRPNEVVRGERMNRALGVVRNRKFLKLAKDKAMAAGQAVQEKAAAAGQAVQDKAMAAGQVVQDKAMAAGQAVQDKAMAAGQAVQDRAASVGQAVQAKLPSRDDDVPDSSGDGTES